MQLIILIAVLSGFIGLYILAMALNAKVAIPESCKEAYLEAQSCESCSTRSGGCHGSFKDAIEFMKEVKL
jgi:hypothetical protein